MYNGEQSPMIQTTDRAMLMIQELVTKGKAGNQNGGERGASDCVSSDHDFAISILHSTKSKKLKKR